jgi:hypothetical protein
MPQLDELLSDLAKAKDVEAAAALDACDRAQDLREAKDKLARADHCHAAAKSQTERIRAALHAVIEAQTHSAFEDEREEWR